MCSQSSLLLICTFVVLLLGSPHRIRAGEPVSDRQYFPATGHFVGEPFWAAWRGTPEALRVLGYPLSEPFIEESFSEPGHYFRVQFFERAVLEEHSPADAGPAQAPLVMGRLLGTLLAESRAQSPPFQPVAATTATARRAWDSVTRHVLGNTPAPFMRFYDTHGGLATFGHPLSEQFQERNADTGQTYWVQYFERQRLEWHPEEGDPTAQVQLGRLGEEYHAAHAAKLDAAAFAQRSRDDKAPEPFVYGMNATLYYTDGNRAAHIAAGAGFGWIRQQVLWRAHQAADKTIAWEDLDQIVAAVDGAGLKLLLCVVQAPDWATGTPGATGFPDQAHRADYASFLGAVARRYGKKVAAYEIWNEMNLASENGGRPVPPTADYLDLLSMAYDAVKAANREALIISGGAGPTEWGRGRDVAVSDLAFFHELFGDPRFWSHTDFVGVHVFGYANPPETLWPENPGPYPNWRDSREFYFRRVEDVRGEMVQAGHGERQLWMTEFGWATANTTPMHEFGNNNSFEQQADYLVRAFQMGRTRYAPWLGAMFVWNLNFAVTWQAAGNPQHEQGAYGVLNGDWSPRPALTALGAMAKP